MSLQTRLTALAQAVGADIKGLYAALGTKITAAHATNIAALCAAPHDQDPDFAAAPVILTNHVNTPGSAFYWHITTTFYGAVVAASNRAQIAVQYSGGARVYARSTYDGVWTPWQRCDNAELRPGPWIDLRPYLSPALVYEPARAGKNNFPAGRVNNGFIELRGVVNYNVSAAAPASGVMLTLPPELRPAMTAGLVGFADVASPLYFGYATYIVVGATPYNMPGAQHGELRIINMPGGPTSVTTQSFSLDGLRFAQG